MNILLCCAAGMSTSLLVAKMEESAKEQGLNCSIRAVGASEVDKHMEEADVLLLGPQVRYLLSNLKKAGEQYGIPVDSINMVHYGTCNGKEVLSFACKLISSNKG
ncbi:PTS sugar transporter subunit IIB [Bacillus lacus]|uniref:PTS sugar transporter subunit IIB n=1 Tax=Metabacillus lacus TaxID=1983721 RepID=A0A7X2IXE8_9BACI|nr:PTS sugar transporter subunit IIB [Metabacillus lacus]